MIANLRDLSYLKTENGMSIRSNKVIRSANLSQLSPKEITILEAMGIKTVIDMRTDSEIEQSPDVKLKDAKHIQLDIFKNSLQMSPSLKNMMTISSNVTDFMHDIYEGFVSDRSALDAYQQFIRILLEQEMNPVLFHCTFGKDRTGWGTALFLRLLGVSEEDIFADYLRSNIELKETNERLLSEIKRQYHLSDAILEKLKPAFEVDQKYLRLTFNKIDSEYGNFKNYVHEGLNISENEMKSLKEIYLL
ncbi:tyrosine-protein phosphatase [Lactococcus fujiensis]|uniref:Protein tyrosine phosphatase n=1 Tax=Lactococcus fujiensis JCM 16395 TaxID=1291764 RepID=A0A2A5RLL4_9LACT|nr:tyrosine-protein phosphatase [Lactococcus fujiensis]PCS00199.1 hypothetical protein RT41_GL001510 [Lactococcus fujiensis JCM 16395]